MLEDLWSQEELEKTFIQNWPGPLLALSIPHYQMPLPPPVRRALIHTAEKLFDGRNPPEWVKTDLQQFSAALKGPISHFGSVFPRLGSRSPKDCGLSLKCNTPGEVVKALLNSERVWEDLQNDEVLHRRSFLFLRKWVHIYEDSEFRCLIRDRKIVGISQYFYNEPKALLQTGVKDRVTVLKNFLMTQLIPKLHLDSAVVDIYTENPLTVKFLEINPLDSRTDPCLFSWDEEFNETFRYLDSDGILVSVPFS